MALSDPVQFLVTNETKVRDEMILGEVIRLRTREADALATAVEALVRPCVADELDPEVEAKMTSDLFMDFYPNFMQSGLEQFRVPYAGGQVTVYRVWS